MVIELEMTREHLREEMVYRNIFFLSKWVKQRAICNQAVDYLTRVECLSRSIKVTRY